MKIKDLFFKLWFVNGVLLSALMLYVLISFIPKKREQDPGVKIVTEEDSKDFEIEKSYDLNRIQSNTDFIYMPVYTNTLTITSSSIDKTFSKDSLYAGGYSNKIKKICNIKVVNKNSLESWQVFKEDLFVKTMILSNSVEQTKNIFLVIIEDSNKDGYLNKKDETIVYISDIDGKNLEQIANEVLDIELIDNNYLILKSKLDKNRVQYINLDTGLSNYLTLDN